MTRSTHHSRWLGLVLAAMLILAHSTPIRADLSRVRRINAPYLGSTIRYAETAIAWFGRITPDETYTDIRVGYTDTELYINLATFDRLLWYDTAPDVGTLTDWDASTIYLALDGNTGEQPGASTYRLVGQLTWWEDPRAAWQAAYRGDGAGWTPAQTPFTTEAGWRGDTPNNEAEDRGWVITFRIPFAGLGLSGPPPQGTIWGLAVANHNRNAAAGTSRETRWPEAADPNRPSTWAQLAFGMPTYVAPHAMQQETLTVRHKLDGAAVADGAVGGGTICGSGTDFWTTWGQANTIGLSYFNVQNQSDVSDWPCFSRYYVTFPLNSLPSGQAIVSATLTLHQFGNAGEGWDPPPQPSYIQVLSVGEDWTPASLSWNSAPLARENIAATWVYTVTSYPGYPGIPYTWDVSRAVAEAYANDQPLRLAVYSADGAYHSGRYFYSSSVEDYGEAGRPTLHVTYGTPVNVTLEPALWLPAIWR